MKREVRTYLSSLTPVARRHLRTLRELIQTAAPEAVEAFSELREKSTRSGGR